MASSVDKVIAEEKRYNLVKMKDVFGDPFYTINYRWPTTRGTGYMQSLISKCPKDLRAELGTISIGKSQIKVSTRRLLKYMSKHDDEWEDQFYKNLNSRLLTFLDNHEKKWADMSIEERTACRGGRTFGKDENDW